MPARLLPRVVGIGDNVVDDYVDRCTMYPGGNALNFSIYAHLLGCDSAYIGVFGTDDAGRHVEESVSGLGIDHRRCQRVEGPNGRAKLTVEAGERRFLSSNRGGVSGEVPMDFIFDEPGCLESFDLAHTSAYSYMDEHLPRLRTLVPRLSYDFSDDFYIENALTLCAHIDFAFFSCAAYSEQDSKELLAQVNRAGSVLAVATRGSEGALLFDGSNYYRQDAKPVDAIDTLGAGDAFITAFLINLQRKTGFADSPSERTLRNALEQAAIFAAKTCRVHGASGKGLQYRTLDH